MPDHPDSSMLRGLTETEAERRRAAGEGNTAPPATGRTYTQIFTENVLTFMNLALLALGLALALLGRVSDAVVSTAIISLNVLVSVVQEIRAKRALDKIALLTRLRATVIRDGQSRTVMPEDLVIGDLLQVTPGDQIVLDGVVVGDGRLQADESALTGESDLISKQAGDRVFSGSFCVSGSGYYVAEKVGRQSLANQMTISARAFRRVRTPLQETIDGVIRVFLVIVVYLVILLALNALMEGISLADSVQNSALVAGLVPNGLFISISIAYTLAAVRIARLGALVQQANAIESLSHVDVLCLDKTGTLTANRLQFRAVHPVGATAPELRAVLGDLAASTRAGNKTVEALTALPGQARPVVAEVPFSSAYKWSALAFDTPERRGLYALGAPEFLAPYLAPLAEADAEAVARQTQQLTAQGLRVLAVAGQADPHGLVAAGDGGSPAALPRLPAGLTLLGLVSLSDELRPDARPTLAAFVKAGVRPKIISGDSPETVAALARQAGLADVRLVSGPDLEALDDEQLADAAQRATVFGRVTPAQKERLVRALRARGHYVAMIGDGVNDVLSLKQAQLAVAMQSGSQAARSVADIVLLNDSFAALAPAVGEGQRILNGMQDILKLYLTRIATMALLIVSAQLVGYFPLELRHGSALTLFSVGIPTILLALWARPGPAARRGLTGDVYSFVVTPMVITTVLGVVLFYAMLLARLRLGGLWVGRVLDMSAYEHLPRFLVILDSARSVLAIFMVLAGILLVILVEPPTEWWACGDTLSGDWRPTWLALGLAAVFILVNMTPLRRLFALSPVNGVEALAIGGTLAVWLFTVRFFWRQRIIARFIGPIS
jgi:cation-transporting P-type ATPase E